MGQGTANSFDELRSQGLARKYFDNLSATFHRFDNLLYGSRPRDVGNLATITEMCDLHA